MHAATKGNGFCPLLQLRIITLKSNQAGTNEKKKLEKEEEDASYQRNENYYYNILLHTLAHLYGNVKSILWTGQCVKLSAKTVQDQNGIKQLIKTNDDYAKYPIHIENEKKNTHMMRLEIVMKNYVKRKKNHW